VLHKYSVGMVRRTYTKIKYPPHLHCKYVEFTLLKRNIYSKRRWSLQSVGVKLEGDSVHEITSFQGMDFTYSLLTNGSVHERSWWNFQSVII
jgi:hypothetical protein